MNYNPFGVSSLTPNFFTRRRPINPQQFQQGVCKLSQEKLDWLVQTARYSGVAEQDIQSGLDVINNFRKSVIDG